MKTKERTFKVIDSIRNEWDIDKLDLLYNFDESKINWYSEDRDDAEIKEGVILTLNEVETIIMALEEPWFIFQCIEEITLAEDILKKMFDNSMYSYGIKYTNESTISTMVEGYYGDTTLVELSNQENKYIGRLIKEVENE